MRALYAAIVRACARVSSRFRGFICVSLPRVSARARMRASVLVQDALRKEFPPRSSSADPLPPINRLHHVMLRHSNLMDRTEETGPCFTHYIKQTLTFFFPFEKLSQTQFKKSR